MTYVVAEIGVNWDGDLRLAEDMMIHAKNSGCDAVKFQAFVEDMVKDHPESSRLMKTSISSGNIEAINKLSKSVGIEWFCTPMYAEAVNLLEPYVKKFKIRVADGRSILENNNTKLFDAVLKTNKEIIISCEISPRKNKYYQSNNVKWLYCVPKYPCEFSDLNFSNIGDFDGYSNHCAHFLAPLTAVILGAEIIELHITSDKSKNFVDNNVSFDYDELENTVKLIRLVETMKI
jgi:N,N'-diacetyllegionaminate synthase